MLIIHKETFYKLAAVLIIAAVSCVYSIGGGFRSLNVFLNGESGIPLSSVETEKSQFALTFDVSQGLDHTTEILDILAQKKISATFFLTGDWIDRNKAVVKKMQLAGHELENHSGAHLHLPEYDDKRIAREVLVCSRKIELVSGQKARFFRAPFNEYNSAVRSAAAAAGLLCVQGDVNGLGISLRQDKGLVDELVSKTGNGSILMLPCASDKTPEILSELIDKLKSRKLEPVKLTELVLLQDFYVDHAGVQRSTGKTKN